jgi:trehalose-6-phosphatase
VKFTVRLPRKLYERVKKHREINWSVVVRRSIEEYLGRIEGSIPEVL